jgi:hypothetical protein
MRVKSKMQNRTVITHQYSRPRLRDNLQIYGDGLCVWIFHAIISPISRYLLLYVKLSVGVIAPTAWVICGEHLAKDLQVA